MDEEDGRPGALAAQVGQLDAHKDVLALSLRLAPPTRTILVPVRAQDPHLVLSQHRTPATESFRFQFGGSTLPSSRRHKSAFRGEEK